MTEQEIKISKAKGLQSAVELSEEKYDLLSTIKIMNICEAIIDSIDGTDEKYNEVFLKAVGLNKWVNQKDNSFVFRVSNIKFICEFIMRGFKNKRGKK